MRFSVLLLATACLALLVGASAASAESELPGACEVTSLSLVAKTLRLEHAFLIKNSSNLEGTAGEEPAELPSDVHTVCGVGLWSGSKPKSRAGVLAKAKSGQGAQVAILTWAPNDASPNVEDWIKEGYEETTNEFVKTRFHLVYNFPGKAKSLNPNGEGYSGAGALIKASGIAKGLAAAIGCWWDNTTHRDVCVFDEEAEGNPLLDHLNALAKTIVPNFLGAP